MANREWEDPFISTIFVVNQCTPYFVFDKWIDSFRFVCWLDSVQNRRESKQYGFALVNLHKQISRAKKGWNKQTHTRTNAYTFSLEYLKQLRTFDVCLYLVFRLGVIRTLNSKTKFIWWKCTRSECQMKCGRDGAYYSRYLISIISKRL